MCVTIVGLGRRGPGTGLARAGMDLVSGTGLTPTGVCFIFPLLFGVLKNGMAFSGKITHVTGVDGIDGAESVRRGRCEPHR